MPIIKDLICVASELFVQDDRNSIASSASAAAASIHNKFHRRHSGFSSNNF